MRRPVHFGVWDGGPTEVARGQTPRSWMTLSGLITPINTFLARRAKESETVGSCRTGPSAISRLLKWYSIIIHRIAFGL